LVPKSGSETEPTIEGERTTRGLMYARRAAQDRFR
jgi:hypothetical protein